jgi:hypothetical protein
MSDDPDLMNTLDHQAIAEAIAYQNAIDRAEAGPKAPHGAIAYKGVVIDSRWDVLSEYRQMRAIVDRLPDLMRVRIESIWCDSNCTANYVFTVKPSRFIRDLPLAIENAVIAIGGGHNGIAFQSDVAEGNVTLDCHWIGDSEE